jgi:hypothetical protein
VPVWDTRSKNILCSISPSRRCAPEKCTATVSDDYFRITNCARTPKHFGAIWPALIDLFLVGYCYCLVE